MPKKIDTNKLLCMNDLADQHHFRVDLAYTQDSNLLFGERIYSEDAKLWLYEDLAHVVCRAAQNCYEEHGLSFVLYDGLRTVEAQEAMMHTQRAKDNPHWMETPRLLSIPGGGGHPRGMAIDIGVETKDGKLINMGCPFDFLADNSSAEHNPAHREYNHPEEIRKNRAILDDAMMNASADLGVEITPLTEEWWDFRLPQDTYEQYPPLSERNLPALMKIMS